MTDEKTGPWKMVKHPATLIAIVLLACWLAYATFTVTRQTRIALLAKDEILVLRTPGGMLEVSTLVKNEVFAWSTKHTCPLIDCSGIFKATISEIRIPVHYTYRIPLSETWTLKSNGIHYELTVPRVDPKVPAAIDFTRMEMRTSKGWFSPSTTQNREALLRQLGPELTRRSTQQHYIDAQRAEAKKTIGEFADKWMAEQKVEKRPIKVIFSGEAKSTAP